MLRIKNQGPKVIKCSDSENAVAIGNISIEMESCFTDHFFYLLEGLAVTGVCLYLRNRPGAKCLFLKICYTH